MIRFYRSRVIRGHFRPYTIFYHVDGCNQARRSRPVSQGENVLLQAPCSSASRMMNGRIFAPKERTSEACVNTQGAIALIVHGVLK